MSTPNHDPDKTADWSPDPWSASIPLAHVGPTDAIVLAETTIFGAVIPAGYRTDGASVPRAFYNIIARFTDALPAALVHDLRYDPEPDEHGVKRRTMTRKQADREFYKNLKVCGVNYARRQAAYRAVRAFGWRPWNAGTKAGTLNVGDTL
ncbi:MAG: DUF1353 domain-containing protein [Phycisphaeraceae bacterium]